MTLHVDAGDVNACLDSQHLTDGATSPTLKSQVYIKCKRLRGAHHEKEHHKDKGLFGWAAHVSHRAGAWWTFVKFARFVVHSSLSFSFHGKSSIPRVASLIFPCLSNHTEPGNLRPSREHRPFFRLVFPLLFSLSSGLWSSRAEQWDESCCGSSRVQPGAIALLPCCGFCENKVRRPRLCLFHCQLW